MRGPTSSLYFWVLLAIVAGSLLGYFAPAAGTALKPLSDAFIALIKMLIGPVIFCTVVHGIAGAGSLAKLGRVGGKAFLYFEIISTIALALGLLIAHYLQPGAGMHADIGKLDASKVADFNQRAEQLHVVDYLLHIIPKTFVDAFVGSGDLLQVLLVSILFGIALNRLTPHSDLVVQIIETLGKIFFGMVGIVMKAAPIGAGAAMAYTVGQFGIGTLKPLVGFVLLFYSTCIIFVIVVLGTVARGIGFNIFKYLRYIRTELLTVLGTSSSESALVPLMQKLQRLGCSQSIVGLVVPSGYSFNLDGTNIYMTLATLFVAQALDIDLSSSQIATVLLVAMLTSKGASGVTGAGFVTLAATLATIPSIPVAGLTLILGVDRFMSEARALTNFIGNGIAAIVISKWEHELDMQQLQRELAQ
ncbi:MAG TPA: C4-dicarboxylate transporter DctA [Spongiibacteraceae bacterium]